LLGSVKSQSKWSDSLLLRSVVIVVLNDMRKGAFVS